MSDKNEHRDDGQDMAKASPLRPLHDMHERYDGLRATSGLVTVDLSRIWCGWLLFGFSGDVTVSDQEEADGIAVIHADGHGMPSLFCETAYCSPVLRDLCDDLSAVMKGEAEEAIDVFCEAEEHGDYDVSIAGNRVGISVYPDEGREVCSVARGDDGSYLAEMTDALVALRQDILSRDEATRADILESLALFCERVTEDADGGIDVEDATEFEALDVLAQLS